MPRAGMGSSARPFGVGLPGVQQIPSRVQPWERELDGDALIAVARAAEDAGFAWVSASDHVAVPASRAAAMGATWYDAGSTLAFVAGGTRKIRLLAHVVVLPYRHPLVVAKQWGTLDRLSGGRVILGVGSGHLKPEFASVGADFTRRGRITDESVAAVVAAWESEVATFAGKTIAFRDVLVSPRPAQSPRPPVWVGGNSAAAIRRAARLGDGWIPWQLSLDDFRAATRTVAGERAAGGRAGDFAFVAPLGVPAEATADAVAAEAAGWAAAGATAFHVGVGARSLREFHDRVGWFAAHVAPRLG